METQQEKRDVSGFDEIVVQGTGELTIEQGDQEELVIEADAELLPKLKSDVNQGRLELGLRHWYDFISLIGRHQIRYRVKVRNLRGVAISGSARFDAGPIQTDRLILRISGSGDMSVASLTAQEFEIILSGSGKIAVNGGSVMRQEIEISGSGEIDTDSVACPDSRLRISGSGNVRLQAQERLEARISGAGDVRYRGSPRIEQRISGSGRIWHA